ncbi:MAG: patatin family protein [Bacilli bacterium]
MKNDKVALVLQGGAVRGAFTAGVLDVFMENDLYFQYVVGVSAGALIALSYLSKQVGRSRSVVVDYMSDKRFVNPKFLFTKKTLFNFDYLFGEMAEKILPFDFDTFEKSEIKMVVGTTSCLNGEPLYFVKGETSDFNKAIAASSSLPFFSAPVSVESEPCMDGGLAAPIPFRKALDDGFDKIIVITTRDKNYRKDLSKRQHEGALKALYGKYPVLIKTILDYPKSYNQDAADLEDLEAKGQAFVIRPREPIMLKRTEKDKEELQKVYLRGRKAAEDNMVQLMEYLK